MIRRPFSQCLISSLSLAILATTGWGQNTTGSNYSGLRPANSVPSTTDSVMVPINPSRGMSFDPYSASNSGYPGYGSLSQSLMPQSTTVPSYSALQPPSLPYPNSSVGVTTPGYGGYTMGGSPIGGPIMGSAVGGPVMGGPIYGNPYPSYTGPQPILPGAGQSAVVQTSPPYFGNNYPTPSVLPNNSPSALFPGAYNTTSNGWFGNLFGGSSSSWFGGGNYAPPTYNTPAYNPGVNGGAYNPGAAPGWGGWSWTNGFNWNPQGSVFNGQYGQPPGFVRLLQNPRIRHTYIHRGGRLNDLGINDTDVAVSLVVPNFAVSTQPIYISPSFSLHQWAGPITNPPQVTADLPSKAYSAFLDAAWQSDPARILGAELGARVGVFTDFHTLTSKSIRVMGRGIGRIRLTPAATLKLGVIYYDRNKVKVLPAGGLLWQPNPATRLDLFFPEPKLSAYLTTLGNFDTWWYVAGYYGGGTWTIERTDGSKDSIDINDIRVMLGLEWGRNEMMRDGNRIGFAEIGYVFDRELLYKARPGDNLRLNESFVFRAGFGY